MITWITSTTLGKIIATFFISMVPVIELRGGLPYGITLGLDYPLALTAAVLGNMVPVPFIIIYIRHIFSWLRKRSAWWDEKITRLEKKAHLKGRVVRKYSTIGLCILVAIPCRAPALDGGPGGSSAGHAAEKGHPGHFSGRMHCGGHHDHGDFRPDPYLLRRL